MHVGLIMENILLEDSNTDLAMKKLEDLFLYYLSLFFPIHFPLFCCEHKTRPPKLSPPKGELQRVLIKISRVSFLRTHKYRLQYVHYRNTDENKYRSFILAKKELTIYQKGLILKSCLRNNLRENWTTH